MKPRKNGKGNGSVWAQFEHITLVSCYLTPSDSIDVFQCRLGNIEDRVRYIGKIKIFAGDFNSRAVDWGMQKKGSKSWTSHCKQRKRPECEGTIPDITMVSE